MRRARFVIRSRAAGTAATGAVQTRNTVSMPSRQAFQSFGLGEISADHFHIFGNASRFGIAGERADLRAIGR